MINIKDNKNVFVKGFSKTREAAEMVLEPCDCIGNFFVIITDLAITNFVEVRSATKERDAWKVVTTDGTEYIWLQEPKVWQVMTEAVLVVDKTLVRSWGPECIIIPPKDYKKVVKEIEEDPYVAKYRVVGFVGVRQVMSDHIRKIWHDGDKWNAITRMGTHYVF